jgi:regulator of protease activity HflC (stomatin/prohibitin superfamily)
MRVGPLSVIRVPQGQLGIARQNTDIKILLPGTHAYLDALFQFDKCISIAEPLVEIYGTIKFLTVPTGFVRICYFNGKALELPAGRYAINSPTCRVGPEVDMRQENVRFTEHDCMLNGGVNLSVEGLLTYKIVDAVRLVAEMGVEDLDRAIQDVTKAELSKVFASIHLEQISSLVFSEIKDQQDKRANKAEEIDLLSKKDLSVEGKEAILAPTDSKTDTLSTGIARGHEMEPTVAEHEQRVLDAETVRLRICKQVKGDITPFAKSWGVEIVEFQLERTALADKKYQSEYESSTLEIAKAKAKLRSNAALNEVNVQQARADAQSSRIRALGAKNAMIIEAEGRAAATELDASARQKAAQTLNSSFGQQLRLIEANASMVAGIKAQTLLLGDAASQKVLPVLNLGPPTPPTANRL